jgi:hypothetical protein
MPKKKQTPPSQSLPAKIEAPAFPTHVKDLVSGGTATLGSVLMTHPKTFGAGLALAWLSGSIGTAAGRASEVLTELRARRVVDGMEPVLPALEAEGLTFRLPDLEDTITEAARAMLDAETEEKRRMIASAIVELARRPNTAAEKTTALHAISMIATMTPAASHLFYALVNTREDLHTGNAPLGVDIPSLPAVKALPGAVYAPGRDHLTSMALIGRCGQPKPDNYHLAPFGMWLREWVRALPLPEEPADESYPQTRKETAG